MSHSALHRGPPNRRSNIYTYVRNSVYLPYSSKGMRNNIWEARSFVPIMYV